MAYNIDDYQKRISDLPDHDQKSIDIAAEQLRMLQASFNTGSMNINLITMTKNDLIELFRKIETLKLEEFRKTWMFEPPFNPAKPEEWLDHAKQVRIAYLTEQFELISRLRSDEPEAWDEINELFFDD